MGDASLDKWGASPACLGMLSPLLPGTRCRGDSDGSTAVTSDDEAAFRTTDSLPPSTNTDSECDELSLRDGVDGGALMGRDEGSHLLQQGVEVRGVLAIDS